MNIVEKVTAVAKKVGFNSRGLITPFEAIEKELLLHHPHAETDFIRKAYEFSEKAHEGQRRKSGEPYFIHPAAVALLLAECKLDMDTVAAGLLHDVVEDCDVGLDTLRAEFGRDLAKIVDGVTKIGKVRFRDQNEAKAENYRKMIVAMSQDPRVLLVKLADRTHNMQTLDHLKPEKRRRISEETLEIFAPLAHRVGMSHLKLELERLAFYYLEPEAYSELDRQLKDRTKKNSDFMASISNELKTVLAEFKVEADVTSRIKSHYSIYRKLKRKNATLSGLYDYYAFRILTHTVEDCYKIFGLLHGRWRHIPGRIKDFIATPKPNLYQSIHTTLISNDGQPFEVQVRTYMMHRLAEEGVAAHWTYKNGRLLSVGKSEFAKWLKKMAEDYTEVDESDELLENIKGQLQTDEILVFTPASDIKTLTKGATPLDFAYMIHTEVGHHAVGARVDGKLVPLRSVLQSGSIVEILTKDSQRPSAEWLKFVKSPSARTKIRQWLRAEEKKKATEMGRHLFERELKKQKVALKKVNNQAIQEALPSFHLKKLEDFFSAIGFGNLTPQRAVRPFLPEGTEIHSLSAEEIRENRLKRAFNRLSRKSKSMVKVRGSNDVLVHLGKCCNPIVGDEIIGHITHGRGVTVHRKDCKNFQKQHVISERKVQVNWERDSNDPALFEVKIRVFTEDRNGMIADISQAIANNKTNVRSLEAKVNEDQGMGVFDIGLQVHSLDHFKKVIQGLKRVKGFVSYERLN